MTRKEKYPETSTFHFYNQNPKNKYVGDCVIRAISLATEQTWDKVYEDLCQLGFKMKAMPNEPKVYSKYLKDLGWIKHNQPRLADNRKYTGKQFCRIEAKGGKKYLAHIGGHHIVCINDKRVWDIWDSTEGCIGNYWTKE